MILTENDIHTIVEPEITSVYKSLSKNEIKIVFDFLKSDKFSISDIESMVRGNNSITIKFAKINGIYENNTSSNSKTGQILRINPFFSDKEYEDNSD